MLSLHIHMLGACQLSHDGRPIHALKARSLWLLAYLLLHRDRPVSRQQLAFTFWPESSEKQARTNLRGALLQLRRGLPESDSIWRLNASEIAWKEDAPVAVDVWEFEEKLAAANASRANARRAALEAAVALYRGELAPGCYEEWILPERERLHNVFGQALEQLVLLAENERDYTGAIAHSRHLLRHDPLHEATYRHLMRLLALKGDRAGALRVYHTCVTTLRRELGVDPGSDIQEAYDRLLHQDELTHRQTATTATATDRLIGREQEWQTLHSAWHQASRGRPHLALISGEAGMGKSRLAEELLTWTQRQGIVAAHARAYASTGGIAYGPIADLLRNEALRPGWSQLDDLWRTELIRLLPELHTEQPHLPRPGPLVEKWQRHHLFQALVLAVRGDGGPRLLVLDDLQWCDRDTLDWLAFLLRSEPKARLLVVGTVRVEEIEDNPGLVSLLRELRTNDQLIEAPLGPLSAEQSVELARQVANAPLDDGAAARLHRDSGGNPLFVVEMARVGYASARGADAINTNGLEAARPSVLGSSAPPFATHPRIPPKVQAVIEARLGQLSPPGQGLASLAAVLGRSFSFPVLFAASQMDEDILIDALDELWRRRIVHEAGVEGYDFSHDRIRDVAYGVTSRARRRLLHRRAAEALKQVHAGQLGPFEGQVGYHYAQAGDAGAAVQHFRRAAAVDMGRYAHSEAAFYLTAALDLIDPQDDRAVYPVLAEREQVHRTAKQMDAWHADLDQLTVLVDRLEDGSAEAVRRGANLALARYYFVSHTRHREETLALAQEVVVLAQACGDRSIEAEGLLNWGTERWSQGRFDQARAILLETREKAKAAALPNITATSLERRAQIHMFRGGSADRIRELLAEAMDLYRQAGNETGVGGILNKWGYLPLAQGTGDYSESQQHFQTGLTLARRIGNRELETLILRNLGLLFTCQGKTQQAEAVLRETLDVAAALGFHLTAAIVHNYLGFAYLNQGRLAEAQFVQEKALQELRDIDMRLWAVKALTALGWIHFYQGEADAALTYGLEAVRESRAFGELRQVAHALTCLGRVLLDWGEPDPAADAFHEAYDLLVQMEMANRSMEPLAGLADAAWARGDRTTAGIHAAAVADHVLAHPLDYTVDTFLALYTCGRILAAAGDPRAAAVHDLARTHLQVRAAGLPSEHRDALRALSGHGRNVGYGDRGSESARAAARPER